MDAVLRRLAEDSIGAGELSREFSHALAKYLSRRSGVSMRSFGAAFRAAFVALGLEPGARVGVSALAHGAVWRILAGMGLEPVAIDVERSTPVLPSPLNHDFEPYKLDAIYLDSRLGFVPDLAAFRDLRIPLIEDISEALGAITGTDMAGSAGELTIVGLEPEHIVTAGGGACVVTNNTRRVPPLTAATDPGVGEAPLPDMNAAMALTQMRQLESFIERRRALAARFLRTIQRGRHAMPLQGGEGDAVYPALPVLVESSPRDVEQYARSHGVDARRAFQDTVLALMSDADHDVAVRVPNALALAGRMVLFPLYPTLSKAEQESIERVLATMP